MSEKLFEIAFSGQLVEGADLETVKRKIGAIFKADDARLAQMFSGRRVLIKRQVDEITAIKYRGAFQKAGAICEVVPVTQAEPPAESVAQHKPAVSAAAATSSTAAEYVSKYPESDQVPQALLSIPLAVTGDSIEDLATDIAPVGSPMQYEIKEPEVPNIDISGFDVAPVGSELTTKKGDAPPPPPDTSGLSMAD